MPGQVFELNPVSRITTGFIGQPGKRVFYLQAQQGREIITLIVEKQQVEAMAHGIEQFLLEIKEKYPHLPESYADIPAEALQLTVPLDPVFRVGQLGLGYDQEQDLLVMVAQEVSSGEVEAVEAASVARFFATRGQLRALGQHGLKLVRQGRPTCGNCGQPIDPAGHFCPKSNGHAH